MDQIKAIEEKLNARRLRREELVTEIEAAHAELKAARSALLDGPGDGAGRVTDADSRHRALIDTLTALDFEIEKLEQEYSEAIQRAEDEKRESTLAALAKVATAREQELDLLLREAHDQLLVHVGRIVDLQEDLARTRNEYKATAKEGRHIDPLHPGRWPELGVLQSTLSSSVENIAYGRQKAKDDARKRELAAAHAEEPQPEKPKPKPMSEHPAAQARRRGAYSGYNDERRGQAYAEGRMKVEKVA